MHISERPESAKDDLLSKVTAMNLILAFAVSLKHKLRFEPFAHYPDLASLVGHLDTYAKGAHKEENLVEEKMTPWKKVGNYLGMSMAQSNPRKAIKRADKPLGNLPLEILTYLSCYVEEVSANGTLKSPIIYGQISMLSSYNLIGPMLTPRSDRPRSPNRHPILRREGSHHAFTSRLQHLNLSNRPPLHLHAPFPALQHSRLDNHPRNRGCRIHHHRSRGHWKRVGKSVWK